MDLERTNNSMIILYEFRRSKKHKFIITIENVYKAFYLKGISDLFNDNQKIIIGQLRNSNQLKTFCKCRNIKDL